MVANGQDGCVMSRFVLLTCCMVLCGCGSQSWRHGNHAGDLKTFDKRQDERDRVTKHTNKIRVKTTKHYVNEYKKHDGKINFFKRDGFDWGF